MRGLIPKQAIAMFALLALPLESNSASAPRQWTEDWANGAGQTLFAMVAMLPESGICAPKSATVEDFVALALRSIQKQLAGIARGEPVVVPAGIILVDDARREFPCGNPN